MPKVALPPDPIPGTTTTKSKTTHLAKTTHPTSTTTTRMKDILTTENYSGINRNSLTKTGMIILSITAALSIVITTGVVIYIKKPFKSRNISIKQNKVHPIPNETPLMSEAKMLKH